MKSRHAYFRQIRSRAQAGVTIVEMLLYMGLLSILLVILTDMFVTILQVKLESQATSAVEQDGRYILARLSYDIKRATAISNPAALGATSDTLTMAINAVTHTYAVSGGTLTLTNNLGAAALQSSESTVSSISFQRLGNSGGKDTIAITVTLVSKAIRNSGAETRTFQTTVSRRI